MARMWGKKKGRIAELEKDNELEELIQKEEGD